MTLRQAPRPSPGGATQGRSTGFVVGVAASLLDVMGGEFLIPTLVLPFGADIKLAGRLSLAVSLVHHAGGPRAVQPGSTFRGRYVQLGIPAVDGGRMTRRRRES